MLYFVKRLEILDDYDHKCLDAKGITNSDANYPSRLEYRKLVNTMKADFNSAKNSGFEIAINKIAQDSDNKNIYPSLEEKAAILLFLIVKNHAFVNGNKRIAFAFF